MSENKRTTALSKIGGKHQYQQFNGMFDSFIGEFDDAFDHGTVSSTGAYVRRPMEDKDNYFEKDWAMSLCTQHGGKQSAPYALIGQVGSGKSCCMSYIVDREFPAVQDKNVLAVSLSLYNLAVDPGSEVDKITNALLKELFEATGKAGFTLPFSNKKSLLASVLAHQGFTEPSDEWILDHWRQHVDMADLFRAILESDTDALIIVLDNIDENEKRVLDAARSVACECAGRLAKITSDRKSDAYGKVARVVLPLRKYTYKYF